MPYAMAVGAMTVLPFILFKPVWVVPDRPGLVRPRAPCHQGEPQRASCLAVMMQVTPLAILNRRRRHVS